MIPVLDDVWEFAVKHPWRAAAIYGLIVGISSVLGYLGWPGL